MGWNKGQQGSWTTLGSTSKALSQKKCNPLYYEHLAQMGKNLWCAFSGNKLSLSFQTGPAQFRQGEEINDLMCSLPLFSHWFQAKTGPGPWVPHFSHPQRLWKGKNGLTLSSPFHCLCASVMSSLACGGKKCKAGLAVNTLMKYGIMWKKCTYRCMFLAYVTMITKVKINCCL